MLRSLDIRDMLIIDRLSLAFQPGLNVLTGETGAGKSILLDSLGFVLGWRGRAELVRAGADKGEVTAVFDLPPGHAARAVLDEAGIEAEDELILRRVNFADGRKTAWVNDRRVSGEVLRGLSDRLVELHGQHDDRGLLNPRGHRQMLDTFAGLDLSACRRAWTALGTARRTLLAAEEALAAVRAEEDFLRHAVAELDKLDPQPGEEALLDTRRREMQGAEKIRDDIARAHRALSAEGAETLLVDALRWLETASDRAGNRLEAPLAALSRALLELGEAQDGVEACLADLDFDPRDLEALEERLFAIRALARKHSVLPDELGTFAEELRGRLAALDGGTKQIDALRRALAEAEAAWEAEAAILSEARRGAAGRLDAAMAAELAPLKMERAVFETQVTEADPGPEGRDAVAFTVATNPGAPAGPPEPHRLGRRALALPAGAQGLSDGRQPGPHADLRRDRPRGRGRHRRRRGAAPEGAGRGCAGAGRDPLAAGGRPRGASLASREAGGAWHDHLDREPARRGRPDRGDRPDARRRHDHRCRARGGPRAARLTGAP